MRSPQKIKKGIACLAQLCSACRQLDCQKKLHEVAEDVRAIIKTGGLADEMIEHKDAESEVEFSLPSHRARQIARLLRRWQRQGNWTLRTRWTTVDRNQYELGDLRHQTPRWSRYWLITPRGHCSWSRKALQRWTVRISLYTVTPSARVLHRRNRFSRLIPKNLRLPAGLPELWQKARKRQDSTNAFPIEQFNEPIDVVYTWVNGEDPIWQSRYGFYADKMSATLPNRANNSGRFRSRDELRYSLRSIYMYAPFVRHIYIITDDQVPHWLDRNNGRIHLVPHRELFDRQTSTPTFNSRAIEWNIHRISGLSEHFIYLNDDIFLTGPSTPEDFFYSNGIAKLFPANRRIDPREHQKREKASLAGHKNSASTMARKLGITPCSKIAHTAFPTRRSACERIESIFRSDVARTKANRWRSWDDVDWVILVPYGMMALGYAVPSTISRAYVDVRDPLLPLRLIRHARSNTLKTLCLNETTGDGLSPYEGFIQRWLANRFPVRAPWELPDR